VSSKAKFTIAQCNQWKLSVSAGGATVYLSQDDNCSEYPAEVAITISQLPDLARLLNAIADAHGKRKPQHFPPPADAREAPPA
jgi:hypothetical protein